MPLEAVIIVLDNSEYNRNGDFPPSRWSSQNEALETIAEHKMHSNPENTIGLMTMAGRRPEIFVSGTRDTQDIVVATSKIRVDGNGNFFSSVKIAQLALKHRENKNQRQRIITFVGHPILEDLQKCEDLGRRLKMNNVAIDIINFANPDNSPKLEALVNAANKDDNSHYLNVPSDFDNLQGILFTSAILNEDFGGAGADVLDGQGGMQVDQLQPGAPGAGAGGIDFAGMDPDLARAIQLSMMDDRPANDGDAQAEAANIDNEGAGQGQQIGQLSIPDAADAIPTAINQDMGDSDDEEEQLRRAIELSKQLDGDDEAAEEKKDEDANKKDEALMDIVTTDYLKDIVKDLDLDVDANDTQGIVDSVVKPKKDEEEKKDDDEKKDGGAAGK